MSLNNPSPPWYKQRWPWILISGPAIVIVAGVITVWLAVVSNDGLVTDDYYKQGLAVNQRLQRDHEAAKMGLHGDLMRSGSNVRMLLSQSGDVGLPERIVLKLAHPTRAGQDMAVDMLSEGQGFYTGKLPGMLEGRWHVIIEDPQGVWRLQGDWMADAEQPLRLVARSAN
ncbi:MAG: FixH family protein [Dechloromonas sp.]|nr:FixH family protein [Dechloromonas sp.]